MRTEPVDRWRLTAHSYFIRLGILCGWNNIKQANTCKSCHISYVEGLRQIFWWSWSSAEVFLMYQILFYNPYFHLPTTYS